MLRNMTVTFFAIIVLMTATAYGSDSGEASVTMPVILDQQESALHDEPMIVTDLDLDDFYDESFDDPEGYESRGGSGFSWCCGDWSSRIAWEARKAYDMSVNGQDYVASDAYAYARAADEAYDIVGPVGPGMGGWCTFFVRLILYRASYWAGYGQHLTTPGYPGSVYSWCYSPNMTQNYGSAKPGWVISSPDFHMGILYQRTKSNGKSGWNVIDSNWASPYDYKIRMHFMADDTLKSYNFWAWWPSWATSN